MTTIATDGESCGVIREIYPADGCFPPPAVRFRRCFVILLKFMRRNTGVPYCALRGLTSWKEISTKGSNPAKGVSLFIDRTYRGYRIRQELIWVRWSKLLSQAGITGFRLYDLRHNFASQLVMKGIDIYTVSKLLGHSKVEMTKVYARLSDEHLKSAVNCIW